MNQKAELKDRVEAKMKRMEARIQELRADGRRESRERADQLQKELAEMTEQTRQGLEHLSEKVAEKLNSWLAR